MELPDTRQLRAFVALAETRSFTIAAKRLYVTQSAVSHSIKSLETLLNCTLFDRTGKKVALTAHGEVFLERTTRVLSEMESSIDQLANLNRWGHGKLRVGAVDSICQYFLPSVLREFRECFPDCEVSVISGDSGELLELVSDGRVDLSISLETDVKSPGLKFTELFSDQLAFAVSPGHPWAGEMEIDSDRLNEERYIVFQKKSYTYRMVERYLLRKGARLVSVLELGNMEAIKEMVKVGLGIGIVAPWMALKDVDEGSLVVIPVPGGSMRRHWGLHCVKARELNLVEVTFTGICETVAADFFHKSRARLGG